MSGELTVGEFLSGLLPRLVRDTTFPSWPPDRTKENGLESWVSNTRALGEKWRRTWQSGGFDDLADEWQLICRSLALPVRSVRYDRFFAGNGYGLVWQTLLGG